ncbi:MAG TPA: Vps62-related protein, partial [Actinomycetota bacterium]|nr:Vps62-related protein [Actinomycetota bacterium]
LIAVAVLLPAGITAGPADAAGAGHASPSASDAERALAERFAPVVRLVHQDVECGPGEPYRPSDVDTVLGDRSVALRGPWEGDTAVQIGPTAEDLGEGLFGYHLDFPGNPLEAGCDYETWARTTAVGTAPTAYAHVATEVGRDDRLALQYWFFYPFNDYTNKHEGDWEMIQLVFAASEAAQALDQTPLEVGYSQHEGLEVAVWDDPKLQIVEGSHPVVFPAAGSHANFYDSALYLGTSAEQGFGCDDTRGPSDDVRPTIAVIPADPTAAVAAFPWIAYQGRWGQREASFYNGPTGPNTKDSWTHPITYQAQKGRDLSYAVPGGGLLGTSATDFFCGTVSSGSEVVRKLADHPVRLLLVLAVTALLVIYLLRRTTWTPVAPLRAARRRSGGQVIRAAGSMYASRWRVFIGIGLLTIPVSLVVAGLQSLILTAPDVAAVSRGGEGGGVRVTLAVVVGVVLLATSILLVLAATTQALGELDRDAEVDVRRAYRLALTRWRPLLGAFLTASVVLGLLSLTVVLSPVAVVLVVLLALYVPVIAFEGTAAIESLRRSAALVRRQIIKTAVLLATSIVLAGAVGPLLGTILILVTGAPFPVANIVAGVTYAVLMPYVGLTMAYLYFDARVRSELAGDDLRGREILPAEIELAR